MTNATRWVGIDLHRRRSHIAIIDDHGELTLSRRIVNDRETFLELLGDPQGARRRSRWRRPTAGSGWPSCSRTPAMTLHLAHPLRTHAIAAARVKTDAVDAARSRTCCAPTCCRRPTSRRASCATCASCCATASR